MNLIVQKNSITVMTDMQLVQYDNVHVEKGAVLVAVPDSSTADEREELALALFDKLHPEKEA
jgi:hypothetical protein